MRASSLLRRKKFNSPALESNCRRTQWPSSKRSAIAVRDEAMIMARVDNSAAIVQRYQDAFGNWREASDETCAAILATMGQTPEEGDAPVWVVRRGERKHLPAPAEITLEDGAELRAETELPEDLPLGYHSLRYLDREGETK